MVFNLIINSFCFVFKYAKYSHAYHDTEGETGDDGVLNGDGSEGDGANMSGENLSDGSQRELGHRCENGRAGQLPQLPRLNSKLPGEVFDVGDRRDIDGGRGE